MIAFPRHRNTNLVYLLLTDEEKSVLEKIETLPSDKLLLIDKMIDGVTELPKLETSDDIIELLKSLNLIGLQEQKIENVAKAAALQRLKLEESIKPVAIPPVEAIEMTAAHLKIIDTPKPVASVEPQHKAGIPDNSQTADKDVSKDSGISSAVKYFFSSIKWFFDLFISIITGGTTGLPG